MKRLTKKVQLRLSPEQRERLNATVKAWSTKDRILTASDVIRILLDNLPANEEVKP
jgi:predicted DNA-binding protein